MSLSAGDSPATERERIATLAPAGPALTEAVVSRRSEAFGSLAIPNFRFLLSGTLASSFAMWMEQIGLGWLVQQLTNSPFQLGLVQFIRGFSILFVSPFAGAISERVDRRVLAGAATTINSLNALAIAVLIVSGHIAIWELYITSFAGGFSSSISNPVRQFLVFDAVGEEHLANAIALNSMVNNMARVVGPGIAGFMISFSTSSVFFGESVFLLAATLSLTRLRFRPAAPVQREPVWRGTRLGIAYLLHRPTLMKLTLLQAIPSMLVFPYIQMMPNVAKNYLHVGPGGYGWLQTGVGIGSLISALLVASLAARTRRKGAIASVALLAYMAMILAFSFSRTYVLSLLALIVAGLGLVVFSTFNQTLLQLNVEDEFRGRVLSLYTMSQGLNPFGSLLMGFIAQQYLGAPQAIAMFCGIALALAFLSGVSSKEIRGLE